ncbi:hypothetical protein [Sphaerobacter sp.]|uniref:hypothetical protein n=1 Tax=Sphaerobacter sp. TaxID=2099654 RepID=UPI001DD3DB01|nr:hypothetical protein [Sphaerobacter sp.]MBX5445630.1 hypothetical protein [Sphaerobacter sp.]
MRNRPKPRIHTLAHPRLVLVPSAGLVVATVLLAAGIAALLDLAPIVPLTLTLIVAVGSVTIARGAGWSDTLPPLDRETRRHSRPVEWQALLDIERAQTAPERRLRLAREFRRIAAEALAAPATDRRRWPHPGRLAALARQAKLLHASATDRSVGFLPETLPDDRLSAEVLAEAIHTLTGYLALLAAVRRAPGWDLEVQRVVVRERTRLEVALERVNSVLMDV